MNTALEGGGTSVVLLVLLALPGFWCCMPVTLPLPVTILTLPDAWHMHNTQTELADTVMAHTMTPSFHHVLSRHPLHLMYAPP